MDFSGPLLQQRWRLGPRLGSGAQALTYLARDERGGDRVVVIKRFQLGQRGGWKQFELFEREIAVLQALRHPGIPRFIEHFQSSSQEGGRPDTFNLVMERVPGASLRSYARKVQFTDAELHDILVRALGILDYLHRQRPPVIHRDIKPANLLRDARGNLYLVDFGGVRRSPEEEGGSTVIGTFGYMAPEQLHGEATPATDLYGLGATLVALAGRVEPERVPRTGLRMDLERHLAGRSPALVATLARMTAPDPAERPVSAASLLAELSASRARVAPAVGRHAPARSQERDTLDDVPAALRAAMRVVFVLVGTTGYLGLTVLQVAFLPLVFALIGAFLDAERRPRLHAARERIHGALDEGKSGFRALQGRGLHGPAARRELPGGRD